MTLDGSGEETVRIYRLSHRVAREKSKEKEVTDSGKNEDDNRGGR